MKHYRLNSQQVSSNKGYTDCFVLNHADLTEATDNTDQAVALATLAMGDVVDNNPMVEIVTAFDAPSANATLAVSVGVTSALDTILAAKTLINSGTAAAAGTSFAPSSGLYYPYVTPSGGKTLYANFDITDADGALADCTQGEIRIWLTISRKADRDRVTY